MSVKASHRQDEEGRRLNTASQDLLHLLSVMRERVLHPADDELAVSGFLSRMASAHRGSAGDGEPEALSREGRGIA